LLCKTAALRYARREHACATCTRQRPHLWRAFTECDVSQDTCRRVHEGLASETQPLPCHPRASEKVDLSSRNHIAHTALAGGSNRSRTTQIAEFNTYANIVVDKPYFLVWVDYTHYTALVLPFTPQEWAALTGPWPPCLHRPASPPRALAPATAAVWPRPRLLLVQSPSSPNAHSTSPPTCGAVQS